MKINFGKTNFVQRYLLSIFFINKNFYKQYFGQNKLLMKKYGQNVWATKIFCSKYGGGGQNVIIMSKGSVEVKKLYRSNFAFFLIYSVPFENVNNFCAVSECSSILSTYSVVGCMNQGFTSGFGNFENFPPLKNILFQLWCIIF